MKYQNDNYVSKELNRKIFEIQEEERKRIARELHDSSLQELTHISHMLELLSLYIDDDIEKAKIELAIIRKELKSTINNIRNIVFDLRPTIIDDIGLKESFNVFFSWLKDNTNFIYKIDIDEIENDSLLLINIYRIVVECVLNSVKHSEGSKIDVEIKKKEYGIDIKVRDNGKGFNIEEIIEKKINYGISIIYERVRLLNGNIVYNSDKFNGTVINISIPLNI